MSHVFINTQRNSKKLTDGGGGRGGGGEFVTKQLMSGT